MLTVSAAAFTGCKKELVENGNEEATFDFSLITAFKVVEKE